MQEVVRHPGWIQAFDAVMAGLDFGAPVVLAGAAGRGKSLFLRSLAHHLRQEGRVVTLLPGHDPVDERRPDIVLLDEADRVPPELLRHLAGAAPRCVLAGSSALLDIARGGAASPVLVTMRPLRPDEVGSYLLEQVERAGLPDSVLEPGAIQALVGMADGNPRRLQALAGRALFHSRIAGADRVSALHVAEAGTPEESLGPALPEAPPVRPARLAPHPPLPGPDRGTASLRRSLGPITVVGGIAVCLGVLAWRHGVPTASYERPAQVTVEEDASPASGVDTAGAAPEPALPMPVPPLPDPVAAAHPLSPPLRHPAMTPAYVVIAFPQSDPGAGSRGLSLADALQDAGMHAVLSVGPPGRQTTPVRYFYADDQATAALVARQMGEPGREQRAAIRGALPRPGTIQVVMPPTQAAGR